MIENLFKKGSLKIEEGYLEDKTHADKKGFLKKLEAFVHLYEIETAAVLFVTKCQ